MNAFQDDGAPAPARTETGASPNRTGRERTTDTGKSTSLERTFEVFTAPKKDSRTWRSEAVTWDEFTSWAEEPADRKECGNYIFGTLRGGRRTKNSVVSRSAVQLDADKATEATWEALRALGARGLVHTTFSSRPDALRLRAILPLDRLVTPDEYVHIVSVLLDRLGRDAFDPGSVQAERYMFRPSVAPKHRDDYRFEVMDGPELSADEWLAVEPTTPVGQKHENRPVPAQEHTETPEAAAYVFGSVPSVLEQVQELADLAPGERNARGQGWEEQSGLANGAASLVEMSNTAPVSYPIEQAEADFMQTAPRGEEGRWARKWEWAMKQAANKARAVDDAAQAFGNPSDWGDQGLRSHMRIATRFARYAAGKCLYVHGVGWHYWDGRRWARDKSDAYTHGQLRALIQESAVEALRDDKLRTDLNAASSRPESTLRDAARRPEFLATKVDQDPYLLNCANGTLDLRNMRLRPANPADRITKITRAAFDPEASRDAWDTFLADVLPDPEIRAYVQRYVGMSLVGRVFEHALMIAHGAGRNGKGVLARTVGNALGDYSVTAANDLLTASRYGGKSAGELSALMQLRGARWALMSELNEGDRLAVATLKNITGGDPITAKLMGQDMLEFDPSHSLFMLTNYLPGLPADDSATWARIHVVPFNVSFEGHEDKHLEERLSVSLDAVLAWAVEGWEDYRARGERLSPPKAAREAKANYRDSNDHLKRFMAECCEMGPNEWVSRADFLDAFNGWSHTQGIGLWTAHAVAKRMEGMPGIGQAKRHGGTRGWKGVGLVNDD